MIARVGKGIIDVLASYGLACLLLICLFLLTFFGTLEQTEHGLYDVQRRYFESWFLRFDVGPLPLYFPGGALCMGLLALNLLVGGLIRIRKSRRTIGVIVIHIGIIVMLAAGLVKLTSSDDGYLKLWPEQSSNEFVSYYLWEVAIYDAAEQEDVREFLIPGTDFQDLVAGSDTISRDFTSSELPFELTLSRFVPNCRALPKGPMWQAVHPVIDGWTLKPMPKAVEAEHNIAGVYVTARDLASDRSEESFLWGVEEHPWVFESGGREWGITLRHKVYTMPFEIRLEEFMKEEHPRTGIPSKFMSDVFKVEGTGEQKVRIQMNEPLRHEGLILFQTSWGPQEDPDATEFYSVFAVVRNPSDHWPLYSCIIIGVGMLLAFGQRLMRYIRSQNAARAKAERAAAA